MSPYRIELRPAAIRALRKIHPEDKERIRGAIALLGQDPRPPKAIALSGRPGYRVRVGDYRIIYTIQDDVLLVVVVTVVHRRDVYDKQPPLYFSAKDANGRKADISMFADDQLGSGEVLPGDKSRGYIAFDIAPGAASVMISAPLLQEAARIQIPG